jgi:hypothetical protein
MGVKLKPGLPSLRAVSSTSRKPGCRPYGPEAGPGSLLRPFQITTLCFSHLPVDKFLESAIKCLYPLRGLGLRPSGYDPTRRVQGSKVGIHVQSKLLIDKRSGKPNIEIFKYVEIK